MLRSALCAALWFPIISLSNSLSIEGAWKVQEVQTLKADGSVSSVFPTESQVLFANGFYSFCWTTQPSQAANWFMSDSTKLARVNGSLINTGTYRLEGNSISMKAGFAMNPKFVGGIASYTIRQSGDTLILTGINVVAADKQQNPAYAAGSKFITKLLPVKG